MDTQVDLSDALLQAFDEMKRDFPGLDLSWATSSTQTYLPLMQEDEHFRKPEIHLPLPDHVKSILVDDWEYVTKNLELVPLPSKQPVVEIMAAYQKEETPKRRPGSADADLLEEFCAGTTNYFNMCLGKVLLYKFERLQYQDIRNLWDKAAPGTKWDGKGPADVYGPEHLIRMIVKMPEIIAHTNMDKQSIDRMKEELTKLALWMARNAGALFSVAYEKAPPDYVENAKNASF